MKIPLLILSLIVIGCSNPIDLRFQDKMIGHWRKVEKPYDTLLIIKGDGNKLLVKYQGLQFPVVPDTLKQVLHLDAGTDIINFILSPIDDNRLNLAGEGEFERIASKEYWLPYLLSLPPQQVFADASWAGEHLDRA
ncbi:hypothetical protein [Hymenobacter sp. B1770]|uniref:hypothetical protein n=1 Tax=Hymenobacter sp. B1770 TaxID=1718788 RepID=UPI003CEEB2B9